jgi:hypothetical protein
MKQPKLTPKQQSMIAWKFHKTKLPMTKFCEKYKLDYMQFYFWVTGKRHYSGKDLYNSFETALLTEFGLKVR